jgi:subtilase family serine protease
MATPLTSAQVVLNQPSPDVYKTVRSFFEKGGFTVGPLVANNFAISGLVPTFESCFHTKLELSSEGGLKAAELQLEALPTDIKKSVERIVFSRPPDFGPFNP